MSVGVVAHKDSSFYVWGLNDSDGLASREALYVKRSGLDRRYAGSSLLEMPGSRKSSR
ncbi:hypothetical protein l11_14420 [Neisseria weaveri LMG 5135]|nr:hypothetical protein l11_14420 [Neisseria weaveri LMG 5135]